MKHKGLFPFHTTVLLFHFISMFLLIANLCADDINIGDTLYHGESLNTSQTLVSKGGIFKLGFISEQRSKAVNDTFWAFFKNYYLVISFQNSPGTVIWEANIDSPISDPGSAALELFLNNSLAILQANQLIWSPDVKTDISFPTALVLLDSGNLILCDKKNLSRIIWQSFDHPTNTWLSKAQLGFNTVSRKSISLSYGDNSLEIDSGKIGFILKKNEASNNYYGDFPSWIDIQKSDYNGLVTFYDARGPYIFVQLILNQISIKLVDNSGNLKTLWYAPSCNYNFYLNWRNDFCQPAQELCSSLISFHPTLHDKSFIAGCSSNASLNCQNTSYYSYFNMFYVLKISQYPDDPQSLVVKSENECETTCFDYCSCNAYVYHTDRNICNFWFGELQNSFIQDNQGDKLINIRVHHRKTRNPPLWIFTLILSFVAPLLVYILLLCWRYKDGSFLVKQSNGEQALVLYSYPQIKAITRNFSGKLGEGGFGIVFKGWLTGSTIVAVKKLKSNNSDEKQFRTEVRTIGMIHHTNLVKLLGFCSRGALQMLVYEYMPYGSLDTYLFTNNGHILNWKARYQIMLGIAKGLTYLHEECIDCIIHCDIKPENILLDANFCPKIADFGMAKLLSRDVSRVLTTTRGTIGYLAPEWISGQPITQKADVYSFGLMLFEMISGRRNRENIKTGEYTYFPVHAAIKANQGQLLCLLDDKLEGVVNMEELDRACKVACWCIQDREMLRPYMREVVHMLEGIVSVEMPPVPRVLQSLVYLENASSYYELA